MAKITQNFQYITNITRIRLAIELKHAILNRNNGEVIVVIYKILLYSVWFRENTAYLNNMLF